MIEIAWEGPLSADEMQGLDQPADRGVLAIYGSHPVFGDDALLYVDEARDVAFGDRLERIDHWLRFLQSPAQFYVGRLGGTEAVDPEEWPAQIEAAYRLLVFFHAPPWNSRGIDHHGIGEPTLVLNLGHRHRLALEVSTLWDHSAWDPGPDTKWSPFGDGGE